MVESNIRNKWAGINSMDLILEKDGRLHKLYLGNIEAARNYEELLKKNVLAILTVAEGTGLNYGNKICFHKIIKCQDNEKQNMEQYFQEGVDFIHKQRQFTNVLVHCMAGVSRSVSIVIAYLIQKYNHTYESAFAIVKAKRNVAQPNPEFVYQLITFEKMNTFYSHQLNHGNNVDYHEINDDYHDINGDDDIYNNHDEDDDDDDYDDDDKEGIDEDYYNEFDNNNDDNDDDYDYVYDYDDYDNHNKNDID